MRLALTALILFVAQSGFAITYNGTIDFRPSEIASHQASIDDFVEVAASCLQFYRQDHLQAYQDSCRMVNGKRVCVSKYFGDRKYAKVRGAKRADGTPLTYLGDALKAVGFPESYMDKMEPNSCVGMAMDCLEEAFVSTHQESVWYRLEAFTRLNGVGGLALQFGLGKLGWETYYWNPAPQSTIIADMIVWDQNELAWKSKGHHKARYDQVMNKGSYWANRVDNATDLVGFNYSEPDKLKSVPFWVGTAHTGYHVFPGTFAEVVEGHSTRPITALDNLEFSRFSPFAPGGGPRWTDTEKYRSGLIVVPPSF